MRIESRAGQNLCASGRPQHGLDVGGVAGEHAGLEERLERGSVRGLRALRIRRGAGKMHFDGAHLVAIRVRADLAAKGVGEQLMAIAEA